jgi:hypothetical protein
MSVIKVIRPDTGFAQIPNKFAEDPRLSEAAVAVALFLATRWDGYKIRPAEIQAKFSERPGKPRGREWWARVANELKSANYMWLNRIHGEDGKFVSDWIFCILGLPESPSRSGTADVGSAGIGCASPGIAAAGEGSECIQQGVVQKEKTTTTTTTTSQRVDRLPRAKSVAAHPNSSSSSGLAFETSIQNMKEQLLQIISSSSVTPLLAQQLLDELAGVIEASKRGERTPLGAPIGWFRQLVKKAVAGEFDRNYCDRIANRRDRTPHAAEKEIQRTKPTEEQKQLASQARQQITDIMNTWRRNQA